MFVDAIDPGGKLSVTVHGATAIHARVELTIQEGDILGPERLVGVFCDRAVPVAQLEAAVARDAALPPGCTADTLTIEKRSP